MSATARIVGGAALIVVGVVTLPYGGGFLIGAGAGIAPGGVCPRLPWRPCP